MWRVLASGTIYMRKNYFFNRLLKTILIGSIVQLLCVLFVVGLNYKQYTKLAELVTASNVAQELNICTSYIYDIQEVITEYTLQPSSEKGDVVRQYLDSANKSAKELENMIKEGDNEYLRNSYENVKIKYQILSNNLLSIANRMEKQEIITEKEIEYLVSQSVQTLQVSVGEVVMQISAKNENNIYSGSVISKTTMIISLFISLIIIVTAGYCIYSTVKNGGEMATRQFNAEKAASNNMKKANTDNLTGLWNRKYIESTVNQIIRSGERGYLFMFDMDNFKKVNDVYGHIAGDNVLITFAKVLHDVSRECDICCRAGGDEFMLFAKDLPETRVGSLAERIIESSISAFRKVEGGREVTLSIGICALTKDIDDFQMLYDRADSALYEKKKNGKNGYKIFKNT